MKFINRGGLLTTARGYPPSGKIRKIRKKKENNENFGKIIEISGNLICFQKGNVRKHQEKPGMIGNMKG